MVAATPEGGMPTVLVGMPPSGVAATIDPGWLAADGQRILGSKWVRPAR